MGRTKPINHTSTIWDSSACWLFILEPGGVLKEKIFYLDFRSHWTAGKARALLSRRLGQLTEVPCGHFLCSSMVKRETRSNGRNGLATRSPVSESKESACFLILLVAWRRRARGTSSRSMLAIIRRLRIVLSPASSISMVVWLAPT